jgi:hypothetical protein
MILCDIKYGFDQYSNVVASGASNWAYVLEKLNHNLDKAEELARKALSMKSILYGERSWQVQQTFMILCAILTKRKSFNDETQGYYELDLSLNINHYGIVSKQTAGSYHRISDYYFSHTMSIIDASMLSGTRFDVPQTIQLLESSKSYMEHAFNIRKDILGNNHILTVKNLARIHHINSILNITYTNARITPARK